MILLQSQFCTYRNIQFICSLKFSSTKCKHLHDLHVPFICSIFRMVWFFSTSSVSLHMVACKFIPYSCHPPLYLHSFSSEKCVLIFLGPCLSRIMNECINHVKLKFRLLPPLQISVSVSICLCFFIDPQFFLWGKWKLCQGVGSCILVYLSSRTCKLGVSYAVQYHAFCFS